MDKNSKILITGASGLVGKALVSELNSQGFHNLALPSSTDFDLRIPKEAERLFAETAPDLVFHLAAAVFGLGGNAKYPEKILFENVLINTNVVHSCVVAKTKKIVAMGSGCVYPDLGKSVGLSEDEIWVGPPHPSEGAYAHSKRLLLAHLEAARVEHGLDYCFGISGNIYGPNDNFDIENGHVIPSLIAKFHSALAKKEPVTVWGTGVAVRDFSHCNDIAQGLWLLAQKGSGPVNLGSGNIHSIREIVEILSEITGVEVEWDTAKPDGQLVRYYSLDRLLGMGFESGVSLRDGLRTTYDWFDHSFPMVRGIS